MYMTALTIRCSVRSFDWQEYMMSLVNVSLESSALVTLLWTSFQQSIITEPIMHVLDLLLCGELFCSLQ